VSECYLTASEQFFRYIMAGTNKLRVASTWVHPWFSDGVRVTHPVVFFVCFSCLCTVPNLASVSALFIHDCLWVSLYCGQCLCFVHSWLPLVFSVLWPVSALFIGFLCTVTSVSALFIHDCLRFSLYCGQCLLCSFMIAFGFLCTEASVSALFIHDCLWFSLYCGQCLYFVHSWLIAFGFLQRVCQWDDVCFVLDQHTWYDCYSACSLKPVEG
jgi:hypothetical protein